MTNLSALIEAAHAHALNSENYWPLTSGHAIDGNIRVESYGIQLHRGKWARGARVYINGKRVKAADVKAMLSA
jgi:hypothetical protein